MEDKEMFEKECVQAIPNPNPYVMSKKQYEETKNRKLSKEEIELRKKIAQNAKMFHDNNIKNETDLSR